MEDNSSLDDIKPDIKWFFHDVKPEVKHLNLGGEFSFPKTENVNCCEIGSDKTFHLKTEFAACGIKKETPFCKIEVAAKVELEADVVQPHVAEEKLCIQALQATVETYCQRQRVAKNTFQQQLIASGNQRPYRSESLTVDGSNVKDIEKKQRNYKRRKQKRMCFSTKRSQKNKRKGKQVTAAILVQKETKQVKEEVASLASFEGAHYKKKLVRTTKCDNPAQKSLEGQASENGHQVLNESLVISCNVCAKIFKDKGNLRRHITIHFDKKPFKCDDCCCSFRSKVHLVRHVKGHIKPFVCDACHREFARKSHLVAHKATHIEQKLFVCDVCGKGCRRKSHLDLHLETHKKPAFWCDMCGKRFRSRPQLPPHMALHVGKKIYECKYCGLQFNYRHFHCKQNLAQPGPVMKNPTKDFDCHLCGKTYVWKTSLFYHKKAVHSGQNMYSCDVCGMPFRQRKDLYVHKLYHLCDRERDYQCDLCNRSYGKLRGLAKHLTSHKRTGQPLLHYHAGH